MCQEQMGEEFDPPLKLKLLILGESHVIGEKVEIQPSAESMLHLDQ
jgi:hypothetical protein